MIIRNGMQSLFALGLTCGSMFGQAVTSNVLGTITDPGDATIPNVEIQIKDEATGAVRRVVSNSEGLFRANNLPAGRYSLAIKAQGFKSYKQQAINLASSETRDLGRIQLTLGSLVEEISVTAVVSTVQTASSEKSALVDGKQLNEIALRGRDLFSYLRLLPGVTGAANNETTGTGLSGSINGAPSNYKNFTVDGITDMDTGSNGTVHYEPNLDAIAEIRVLTTNYQAEYGRNSGGVMSVITKGGGQQFHGSAWETKRHEQFNANSFFNNYNGNQKSIYRYDVFGYSIGGPVYIPKLLNRTRNKLFFFVSQEYTRQRPSTSINYFNLPTAAERVGDFSKSVDTNGKLIGLLDPTTRAPIPGNIIPATLIKDPASAAYGKAMLNFLPLPNRCDLANNAAGCYNETDPTQLTRRNYQSSFTGQYPRRNDVVRFDSNITSKLLVWGRYINDYDRQDAEPNIGLRNAKGEVSPYYTDHPNPGHGWGVGITYTISPTIVHEFTYGKSYNTWDYYVHDPSQVDRAQMGNPPHWFDENDANFKNDKDLKRPTLGPGSQNFGVYVPQINFGAPSANQNGFGMTRPYTNWNDLYTVNDSISFVKGQHNIKAGFYYERTGKVQQSGQGAYLGTYNFGSSSSFPQDTNNGYANAYIGNFQSYSEGARIIGDFWFTGVEAFVQDNWRVNRRLTLDLGMRFYHLMPQENLNLNSAAFVKDTYDRKKAPRLYYPACNITIAATAACPAANQVAKDLGTGLTTFPALAGTFVPYSAGGYTTEPNVANGMQIADGTNPKLPLGIFEPPYLAPAVRIGLAWDVFGTGRTAIRTGFGQFFNRGDGNQIMGMGGNPPVTLNRTIYYSPIASIPSFKNSAAISPISNNQIVGKQAYESTLNFSFGVQHNVGFGTIVDAAYVGSLRRHTNQGRQANAVPMFSQFNPEYNNPWQGNLAPTASGKALNDNYFRPLAGLGGITYNNFEGTSNYHALQVGVRRAMSRGLQFGIAYTMSKTMSSGTSVYFTDKFRNYGPSFSGAPHIFVANYIYDLPGLGKKFNKRALGWVIDNWKVSGITEWQSHAITGIPGFSFTGTSTSNPAPNLTGSAEGARMVVLGNPELPNDKVDFYHTFNPNVFQPPTPCSWTNQSLACFGNAGPGSLMKIPTWVNNWDMTMAKNFTVKEKYHFVFRAEAYNVWNHTQFSSINSGISYDLGSYQNWIAGKSDLVQTNNQLGRYNGALAPRRMAFSLRFQF